MVAPKPEFLGGFSRRSVGIQDELQKEPPAAPLWQVGSAAASPKLFQLPEALRAKRRHRPVSPWWWKARITPSPFESGESKGENQREKK